MQEQIERLLCLNADKKILNYVFSMQAIIGRGSFGVVYVGRHVDTGQPVALKVVPTAFPQTTKETDIMKDLDSPNIVKLIEVLRTDNNFYIVSELCTGGDLKEYMKKYGALAESIALNIISQILRGILQSFKRGIIHRDLKPANILIAHTKDQQILFKIADFGFAKRFTNLENDLMNSLVGTPLYMSPQVLLRRPYTSKCDVWSVGLIYYELLEGRTPWDVTDILDLVSKQRQTKITFSKNITQQSQQFILGCLQYEEAYRFTWEQLFTHPLFQGIFDRPSQQCQKQGQVMPSSPRVVVPQQIKQQGRCGDTMRIVRPHMETEKQRISSEINLLKNVTNCLSNLTTIKKDRACSLANKRKDKPLTQEDQLTTCFEYQNNLVQNYLAEEFNRNKCIIQDNLDYLKFLWSLRASLSELFKTSPAVLKLEFLLSKHAMIKSTSIKVQMIDRGDNCLALKEFSKFQQSEVFLQLEKQIVEIHFEIYNQFQDNFLHLNENLNMVIYDSEFQEIFNYDLGPSIHFAAYAFSLTSQFLKEYVFDSQALQRFQQAISLYCDNMKHYQFLQTDIKQVLATMQVPIETTICYQY